MIVSFINAQDLFRPGDPQWVLTLKDASSSACFISPTEPFRPSATTSSLQRSTSTRSSGLLGNHPLTREQFDALAVALNTGVNIPSIATPNGQAAFLFLLSSALAPLIQLSLRENGVDGAALFQPTTLVGLLSPCCGSGAAYCRRIFSRPPNASV